MKYSRRQQQFNESLNRKATNIKFLFIVFIVLIVGLLSFGTIAHAETSLNPASKSIPLPSRVSVILDMPQSFDADNIIALVSIENLLRTSTNTDFTIRLTGMGGDVFLVNDFIRAMEDSQHNGNRIFFDVIGIAASGHAFIACEANKVTLRPGSSLLFHQAYGVSSLFFGLVQIRQLSNDIMVNNMINHWFNQCAKNGRLTQQDIKVIKSGDDVIYRSEDGKIVKDYAKDYMTITGFTIPNLLSKLSNILTILIVLGGVCYVIRRAGK